MAVATAPDRSLTQRMDALDRANDVRTRRAELKRNLKADRRNAQARVRRMIAEPPEWLETMHVRDLLLALPKWGKVKVDRFLNQQRVSPSKTLGGLSQAQRDRLCGSL